MSDWKEILFVCTGNICRSPMAEAFLRAYLDRDEARRHWRVGSAGIYATDGNTATDEASVEMDRRGFDLRSHRARQVTRPIMAQASLVLAMTAAHVAELKARFPDFGAKIYTLSQMVGQDDDVADPYGGGREVYAYTASVINELIDGGYSRIVRLVEGPTDD